MEIDVCFFTYLLLDFIEYDFLQYELTGLLNFEVPGFPVVMIRVVDSSRFARVAADASCSCMIIGQVCTNTLPSLRNSPSHAVVS